MASASNATVIYLNEHPVSAAGQGHARRRADAMGRHPSQRNRRPGDTHGHTHGQGLATVIDLHGSASAKRDAGAEPNELAQRVGAVAKFFRSRLTGDYPVDEFGFDPQLTEAVTLPMLRTLFKLWFRVDVTGTDNLPQTGAALLVANHAGMLPLDGLMASVAVHDHHPAQRALRVLATDTVFDTPLVGQAARTVGQTRACNADAHQLLSKGELTVAFPEGDQGPRKRFADRYKLQPFGGDEVVSAAVRTRAPIIPCSIVGSEETYPVIGELTPLARLLKLPYFPITPLFPLAGPAGLIPLPSKWHIEFGAPIPTTEFKESAAEDPEVISNLTEQVRDAIQLTLCRLQAKRRNTFLD